MNREYEMITYGSKQEAQSDNAVVIHKGACGVCSSAKDLSVWMINDVNHSCSATEYVTILLPRIATVVVLSCVIPLQLTLSCSYTLAD
jgi:hypothetical protein